MTEPIRATTRDTRDARSPRSAHEAHGRGSADLGNLAIVQAVRGGAPGVAFTGAPLGNLAELQGAPTRCGQCEARSRRYGVQAKCGACQPAGEPGHVQAKRRDPGGTAAISSPGDPDEARADAIADQLAPSLQEAAAPAPAQAHGKLPDATRAVAEASLGTDLSSVRLHADGSAASSARRLGAWAFTRGDDVSFDAGRLAPHTREGAHLLAHELAHVAQQRSGTAQARIQRDGPPGHMYLVQEGAEPLSRYTVLAAALDPGSWRRLNHAARARIVLASRGGVCRPEDDDSSLMELQQDAVNQVTVPLSSLLQPPAGVSAVESGDFVTRMFDLLAGDSSPSAVSQAPLLEAVGRWKAANPGLADAQVTVALIDPDGQLGGDPGLTFQVNGRPVPTLDGSMYILPLDQALGLGSAAQIESDVTAELQDAQQAAVLAHRIAAELARGDEIISQGYYGVNRPYLTQWLGQMQQTAAQAHGYSGRAAALLAPRTATLDGFIAGRARSFVDGLQHYIDEHRPDPNSPAQICGHAWEDSPHDSNPFALMGQSQIMTSCAYMPGTQPEYQAQQAFQAGLISLKSLEKTTADIEFRSEVAAGITLGLTVLSMGLAGPVLGTAPSLTSLALYGGTSAALTTAATMGWESWYTLDKAPELDPYARQILMQGYHTPGQIAVSSLISFGIGAGTSGLAGWLARGPNPATLRALVAQESTAVTTLGDGVTVTQTGPHAVELRMPGQPDVIRVTQQGYELLAPAGDEDRLTSIGSFAWAEEPLATQPGPAGTLQDFAVAQVGGQQPVGFGVTQEGNWIVYQPGRTGLQTGTFGVAGGGTPIILQGGAVGPGDELAMVLAGRGGANPLVADAETQALVSGDSFATNSRVAALLSGEQPIGGGLALPGNVLGPPLLGAAPETGYVLLDSELWNPPASFHDLPAYRLPALPEGWAWTRSNGTWWPMRGADAADVAVDVYFYRDAQGRMNANLRTGDGRFVSSSAMTLPKGLTAPVRDYPMTTGDYLQQGTLEPWDRGHLLEHYDTLRGPGVPSSTTAETNYVPEPRWWNRWIRGPLVGQIRARGNGYRMIYYFGSNPRVTMNGTLVPDGVYFSEVTPSGQTVAAWNVPFTDPVNGPTGLDALGAFRIDPSQVPATPVIPTN